MADKRIDGSEYLLIYNWLVTPILIYITGLSALVQQSERLSKDTGVSMLACFDHEEIGSDSAQGIGSLVHLCSNSMLALTCVYLV